MKRINVIAGLMMVAVPLVLGQEKVGTTTGGPLTVAGVPIYGIANNGDLFWYFHRGAGDGSPNWANKGQRVKVGNGWNEGLNVFKGSPRGQEGVIYRVDSKGDLYWYRHTGFADGSFSWANGAHGIKIGSGWQGARLAFAAGDGLIYLIDKNGDLFWYHHLGYRDGSDAWANAAQGVKVGVGWGDVRLAIAGGNGIIYGVDSKGDLYWYRHTGFADGSFSWANDAHGIKIGSGWNDAASAFSGGNGVIYVMKGDGNLYWYNHTGFSNGAPTWASLTGNRIGSGWEQMVRIF